jgi:predicted nucleic acid-binding protein
VGAFASVPLIVDTSALVRWRQVPDPVRNRFREALQAGELRTHPIVRLEFLHDAYDRRVFEQRLRMFSIYKEVSLDASDSAAAIKALDDLSHLEPEKTGYHKVKTGDVLMAASAIREGVGVLHFDHDFERLAEVMPLVEVAIEPFPTMP